MKMTIDQISLLLEKKNITLPNGAWNKDNGDQHDHIERGHALMESVSNEKYILIELGFLDNMVARKYSFS